MRKSFTTAVCVCLSVRYTSYPGPIEICYGEGRVKGGRGRGDNPTKHTLLSTMVFSKTCDQTWRGNREEGSFYVDSSGVTGLGPRNSFRARQLGRQESDCERLFF